MEAETDSKKIGSQKLMAAGGTGEFLTRVLRNGIDEETTRIEHGQLPHGVFVTTPSSTDAGN